jgi:rhodanese-related sulfurtransferase
MNVFKTNAPRWMGLVILALSAAVLTTGCSEPVNAADRVTLEQARADHEAGKVMLVDIRETREHKTGVAAGAVLLPMSELPQKLSLLPKNPDQEVLLICNTQNRSKATLQKLKEQGYQNIRYVDGGMSQWAAKGWPMVAPQ